MQEKAKLMHIQPNPIIKEYDCKLDSKKRFVVRGERKFENYHVTHYRNGVIVLEPRVLINPNKGE